MNFDEGSVFSNASAFRQQTEGALRNGNAGGYNAGGLRGLDSSDMSGIEVGLNRESEQDIKDACFQFLRDFQLGSEFVYREQIRDRLRLSEYHVEIRIEDLRQFNPWLAAELEKRPNAIVPLFEKAAKETAAMISLHSANQNPSDLPDLQVLFRGKISEEVTLRHLQAVHVSKMVAFEGIVISTSKTKSKASSLAISCRFCNDFRELPLRPGLSGISLPRRCSGQDSSTCGLDPYRIVPERCLYIDQQILKIQELPEAVPTGEISRHVLAVADRSLSDRVSPGTRVRVLGVYQIHQPGGSGGRNPDVSAVAVRHPYIRILGMELSSGEDEGYFEEEIAEYESLSNMHGDDILDYLSYHIDPAIFGHKDIKKALAAMLFGGTSVHLPDGIRLRGDINVLLLGDPSAGKSQLLKYVQKIAPIGVYTSGKGSSAAGLTASVIRDSGGEFYLEGGSMVLADGGIVCIDEFDKMREQDRVAIHEAMEQQTISIAKAGITTVLNSRTAVLAAANPSFGRYDDTRAATDQIEFQTTILSRFDLIFLVRDIRHMDKDKRIAEHVIKLHSGASGSSRSDAQTVVVPDGDGNEMTVHLVSPEFLKRFIAYARSRYAPVLSEGAESILANEYVSIREDARRAARGDADSAAIPITVRQLQAIIRISEAIAKMSLRSEVSQEHVRKAIDLFKRATVEASLSGISTASFFTSPEEQESFKAIEGLVTRFLAVGRSVPESQFIDYLGQAGFELSTIRKAIFMLVKNGMLRYRNQRKHIYRQS